MMDRFILIFVNSNVSRFSENVAWFPEYVAQFPKFFSWFAKMCLSFQETGKHFREAINTFYHKAFHEYQEKNKNLI